MHARVGVCVDGCVRACVKVWKCGGANEDEEAGVRAAEDEAAATRAAVDAELVKRVEQLELGVGGKADQVRFVCVKMVLGVRWQMQSW